MSQNNIKNTKKPCILCVVFFRVITSKIMVGCHSTDENFYLLLMNLILGLHKAELTNFASESSIYALMCKRHSKHNF